MVRPGRARQDGEGEIGFSPYLFCANLWGLKRRAGPLKRLICTAALVLLLSLTSTGQEPPPRFKLFKTQNMWTQILLDTRLGRVWQVSFSVKKGEDSVRLPINTTALVDILTSRDGRFTLEPTENMWTFLLLDQDGGMVWQCQFSMDNPDARFIDPILPPQTRP
jgi:hypothetical protein